MTSTQVVARYGVNSKDERSKRPILSQARFNPIRVRILNPHTGSTRRPPSLCLLWNQYRLILEGAGPRATPPLRAANQFWDPGKEAVHAWRHQGAPPRLSRSESSENVCLAFLCWRAPCTPDSCRASLAGRQKLKSRVHFRLGGLSAVWLAGRGSWNPGCRAPSGSAA